MIEKKNINTVTSQVRSIYQKGIEAAHKNNFEYAIDLLKTAVTLEPGFIDARQELRNLEKKLSGKMNKSFIKTLKIKKLVKLGQIDIVRKKYFDAYSYAEDALALDVKNILALYLMADVANYLEAPFIAIDTLELAREFYPENSDVLKKLANAYKDNKMSSKELDIRKKLSKIFPNDIQIQADLRSASAAAVLEKHDMENKEKTFLDMLKDSNEAKALEQKERVIHDIDDATDLIKKYESDLINNPDSIETLRKLGEIYQKSGIHEKALEYFRMLEEKNKVFDISVDRSLEKSELALVENKIKILSQHIKENTNNSDIEKALNSLRNKFKNIKEKYALKRVKRYPNNLLLRFSLAVTYWEKKQYDLAIEQFQLSQQNPKYHTLSMIFLGRCFLNKKQYDIAIQELTKVVEELSIMNDQKIEGLYYLGIAYEKNNNIDQAISCFKQIYSVRANFKDISKRVNEYYQQ